MEISTKKGQIFSTDFLVAIVIFMFVIVALQTHQARIKDKIQHEEKLLFYEELVSITDNLLLSPGYPEDWNSSNVEVLGLAKTPSILDVKKVEEFFKLNQSSMAKLLGLQPNNFYLTLTKNGRVIQKGGIVREPIAYFAKDNGELELRDKLANSSLIWDFYWGNKNNPPDGGYKNSRFHYNCSDYTGPGQCNKVKIFKMVIENRSSYNTVITEDSEIARSDLEEEEFSSFKNWTKEGGIYFHKTRGTLFTEFNISHDSNGFTEGVVKAKNGILKNVEIGDNVTFSVSPYAVYSTKTDINNLIGWEDDESKSLFGYWDYGKGKVYYIADLTGDSNGYDLMESVKTAPTLYRKGKETYEEASNIYTITRETLLNGERVKFKLVVWS